MCNTKLYYLFYENMKDSFLKKFFIVLTTLHLTFLSVAQTSAYYYLDCTSSTTLISKYRPIFFLSSTTNATISTASSTKYPVIVQCLYDNGLTMNATFVTDRDCYGNISSGNGIGLFDVSVANGSTNLHAAAYALNQYGSANTLCLYTRKDGLFSDSTSTLQMNNCNGYGTTVFSVPNTFQTIGNSHIGDANAYPLKFCLTATFQQALSVSFNTNTIGFGALNSSQVLYASTNGAGTTTATSSLSINVNVVGNTGYSVYLSGDTLRNVSDTSVTIPSIGSSPTSFVVGTDSFGINATSACLSSPCATSRPIIQSPYNTTQFAFTLSTTTPTLIASGQANDKNNPSLQGGSRFLFTLGATASVNLPSGAYISNLTLIVTPTF